MWNTGVRVIAQIDQLGTPLVCTFFPFSMGWEIYTLLPILFSDLFCPLFFYFILFFTFFSSSPSHGVFFFVIKTHITKVSPICHADWVAWYYHRYCVGISGWPANLELPGFLNHYFYLVKFDNNVRRFIKLTIYFLKNSG